MIRKQTCGGGSPGAAGGRQRDAAGAHHGPPAAASARQVANRCRVPCSIESPFLIQIIMIYISINGRSCLNSRRFRSREESQGTAPNEQLMEHSGDRETTPEERNLGSYGHQRTSRTLRGLDVGVDLIAPPGLSSLSSSEGALAGERQTKGPNESD